VPSNRIESKTSDTSSFNLKTPGVRIAPSLLAADFSRLEEEVARVEQAGAEVLHLDVMDGHFVPNISFGIPVIASLRKRSKMFFDAHLMIADPMQYAGPFVKAGCDHITFHCEVTENAGAVVDHIHSLGVSAGISLNPTTEISKVKSVLDTVDLVLVMSVWPGFGGQKFIADVLPKVEALSARLGAHQRLEIDGGVDPSIVGSVARAGAEWLVAGSAVFGQADPVEAMEKLRRMALESLGK